VERKPGSFVTNVYRKPTHTYRYIKFASHYHPRTKTGVISHLWKREDELCQLHLKTLEINHLKKAFEANRYPRKSLDKSCNDEEKDHEWTRTNHKRNPRSSISPMLETPWRNRERMQKVESQGCVNPAAHSGRL
jgi:hypothetical protein